MDKFTKFEATTMVQWYFFEILYCIIKTHTDRQQGSCAFLDTLCLTELYFSLVLKNYILKYSRTMTITLCKTRERTFPSISLET